MNADTAHPTWPLVKAVVERILSEQASGRSVAPSRLAWAQQMMALNPAHFLAGTR